MQQSAGHGYLGVLCPARSLPQKVCSKIRQYSTVQLHLSSRFQYIVGLALEHWFPDEFIVENHRPEWLHGMELDFHILNLSVAVEVDGSQHRSWAPSLQGSHADFMAQVRRDKLKQRLCKENGVRLTRMHQFGQHNLMKFGRLLFSKMDMRCPPLPSAVQQQWVSHCRVLQRYCERAGIERKEATKGRYERP